MTALVLGKCPFAVSLGETLLSEGFTEICFRNCDNLCGFKDALSPDVVVMVKEGMKKSELKDAVRHAGRFSAPIVVW